MDGRPLRGVSRIIGAAAFMSALLLAQGVATTSVNLERTTRMRPPIVQMGSLGRLSPPMAGCSPS